MAFKFINKEIAMKAPGGLELHQEKGLIDLEIAHQLDRIADSLEEFLTEFRSILRPDKGVTP